MIQLLYYLWATFWAELVEPPREMPPIPLVIQPAYAIAGRWPSGFT